MRVFVISFLMLVVITTGVFTQETRVLDGAEYTVIEPYIYAFNADNKSLKVGERYVMDAVVWQAKGNALYLSGISVMHGFRLLAPFRHEIGTIVNVTVYVEIEKVDTFLEMTDAKVIKIERKD